jgi:DNA-binding ferritin-like protein
MKEIIALLNSIYGVAKDLHYSASGNEFYGLHLMYDEIADGIMDSIDEIKENYYLFNNLPVPDSKEIFTISASQISITSTIAELGELIKGCIDTIDEVCKNNDTLTEGNKSMLGDISNDLSKKLGFINRTRS